MVRREQYERLERHLGSDGCERIEMTFAEMSTVIGEPLLQRLYAYSLVGHGPEVHSRGLVGRRLSSPTAQRVTFIETL